MNSTITLLNLLALSGLSLSILYLFTDMDRQICLLIQRIFWNTRLWGKKVNTAMIFKVAHLVLMVLCLTRIGRILMPYYSPTMRPINTTITETLVTIAVSFIYVFLSFNLYKRKL